MLPFPFTDVFRHCLIVFNTTDSNNTTNSNNTINNRINTNSITISVNLIINGITNNRRWMIIVDHYYYYHYHYLYYCVHSVCLLTLVLPLEAAVAPEVLVRGAGDVEAALPDIYIYIYTYIMCVYIYIYIYTCIHLYVYR